MKPRYAAAFRQQKSLFVVLLWLSAASTVSAQTLEVTPNRAFVDESVVIHAAGLLPNEHVVMHAELVDGASQSWSSQAEFIADAQGTVDLSKQAPVKGSYSEISAMGLIWAMMPSDKHVVSYQSPHDFAPQTITFSLMRGSQQVAQTQFEQITIAEGVRQIKLQGQLHGVLFLPSTSGPHPGVLVVGGSEGGVPRQKAAWLASHGYAALALAYFHYENLPANLEAIPLEYFGSALAWMMKQPEIAADQIAVMGTSRGGELALQLASLYAPVKAVVAYVPANVRYAACCGNNTRPYAWTLQGQPLAYVAFRTRSNPQAAMTAAIAIEHTQGAVLLISGEDDGIWSSSEMTKTIVDRLKSSHFAHPVEHLNYPHAGHRVGRPEIVPAWHTATKHPISGSEENLGGSAKGDALSSLDAISKVLEFLQQNLQKPAAAPAR